MDVFSAIQARRSIRKYLAMPIEDVKLNRVLEAARLAPSANNAQLWRFIVVKDQNTRAKLMHLAGQQEFLLDAPVIIVACALNHDEIGSNDQPIRTIDVSIAVSFILLEAWELGLGTCWIGDYNEPGIRDLLNIPENVRVVAITPLGYPAESPSPRSRKPASEIICYEKYA